MEFNREQQQAMEHKDGPMLVLAGPGSGKTEVIIRRTRKLIQNYQVAPSSILVVTFTKAAAGQMRERFLHLCGVKKSQVTFGTFHGIFYGILRQAYGITSANIAGEEIKYQILRQILQNSSLQMEDENDLLESLAREISTVKNGRISRMWCFHRLRLNRNLSFLGLYSGLLCFLIQFRNCCTFRCRLFFLLYLYFGFRLFF